jgi:hypothetical protein
MYQRAVEALAAEGVILGCTSSDYCPQQPVTRAQVASLLARALELPNGDDAGFRDVNGGVHAANINAAAAAGITKGCTDSAFCPTDPITRDQMASMLVRAFDPPSAGGPWFDDVASVHEDAVNRLAAAGIAAGCGDPLTFASDLGTVHEAVDTRREARGQVHLAAAAEEGR